MNEVEEKAMDTINELLENEELPMDRVKSIDLHWEIVGSDYLPVLKCEFFKETSMWQSATDMMNG
jgi:hypothetical protein